MLKSKNLISIIFLSCEQSNLKQRCMSLVDMIQGVGSIRNVKFIKIFDLLSMAMARTSDEHFQQKLTKSRRFEKKMFLAFAEHVLFEPPPFC